MTRENPIPVELVSAGPDSDVLGRSVGRNNAMTTTFIVDRVSRIDIEEEGSLAIINTIASTESFLPSTTLPLEGSTLSGITNRATAEPTRGISYTLARDVNNNGQLDSGDRFFDFEDQDINVAGTAIFNKSVSPGTYFVELGDTNGELPSASGFTVYFDPGGSGEELNTISDPLGGGNNNSDDSGNDLINTEDLVISLSAVDTIIYEAPGQELTLTLNSNNPLPDGGVIVPILVTTDSETFPIGDFDISQISSTGGELVETYTDAIEFRMLDSTATITLPVLDDSDLPPDDPQATELDDIGDESFVFSLIETDDYVADPSSDLIFGNIEQPDGTVYRYFNQDTGVHFYTANLNERDIVGELPNFTAEGPSYTSVDPLTGNPEPAPVYRFLNQDTGVHLYTISEVERDATQELDNFSFEGEAFFAYPTQVDGSIPIYRFFNTTTGAHFYTPSEAERDNVEANLPDFQSEGIAYYALPFDN